MTRLVEPLNLRAKLRQQPGKDLELLPFLDILLIGLFLAIGSSRFVSAPGVLVELDHIYAPDSVILSNAAVLTVDRNQLIFFEGLKIPMPLLEETLRKYRMQNTSPVSTLLIKADISMPLNELFSLFELAKSSGFTRVHLAAENIWQREDPFRGAAVDGIAD